MAARLAARSPVCCFLLSLSLVLLPGELLARASALPCAREVALSSGIVCVSDGTAVVGGDRRDGSAASQRLVLSAASAAEPSAPWVVAVDGPLGAASASLASALAPCGGALAGFLPPSAFLVHGTGACVASLAALPLVAAPPRLLSPELRASPELAVFGAPLPAAAEPVRVASIVLASDAGHGAALARAIAPLCGGACELLLPPGGGGVYATLTALSHGDCAARCPLDAPAVCGCVLPLALLEAVASHASVLWVEAHARVGPLNAFAPALTLSSDLLGSPVIRNESGACIEATDCAQRAWVPFTELVERYSSQPAALGSSDSGGMHLRRRPAGGASAATDPTAPLARVAATTREGRHAASAPHHYISAADVRTALASSPAAARSQASRATALRAPSFDTCSAAACSSPACGQGFATCAGLATLIPLDGAGQLVGVMDSGLDAQNPFFYDPAAAMEPQKDLPLNVTTHRTIAAYWGYIDAFDDANEHGTHVTGTVMGNAAPVVLGAADLAVLPHLAGAAPRARVVFVDFECSIGSDPQASCVPTPGVPWVGGQAPCPVGVICNPVIFSQLYGALRDAGARVVSNSWGGKGNGNVYFSEQAQLDAFVVGSPDVLLVFAAGNDATFATVSPQGSAKNVLCVGATLDGLQAHTAKIAGLDGGDGSPSLPPLYQYNDPRACGAILMLAVSQPGGVLPPSGCPAAPLSDGVCMSLALKSTRLLGPHRNAVQPPYSPIAGSVIGNNIDLAFCCGCTFAQVLRGFDAAIDPSEFATDVWKEFAPLYYARLGEG